MSSDIKNGLQCPYCGLSSEKATGEEIYPHRPDLYSLKLRKCEPCQAWVGVHKKTNRPLGRLANAELRKCKQNAHAAFDPIWKNGKMSRGQAYKELARCFDEKEVHIGEMSVQECTLIPKYAMDIIARS